MSAQRAINVQSKVSDLQPKLSHAAKQSLDRRFGALYDKIYREDVVLEAWKRVAANRGAPGVDRQEMRRPSRHKGMDENAIQSKVGQPLCPRVMSHLG